jgi:SOS response regulatory protein OraA/RecX
MPRHKKFEVTEQARLIVFQCKQKGLSEKQIAKALNISYSTWRRHRHKFDDEIVKGEADQGDFNIDRAENALMRKVLGEEIHEVYVKEIKEGDKVIRTETRTVTKWRAPSDTAIIFFLVNRSSRWQSVHKDFVDDRAPKTVDFEFEEIPKN